MPYAADMYYYAYHPEDTERLPVVLIHGAGGNHLHWPVQARRLSGYRVYALDLPGHGKSKGHGLHQVSAYTERVLAWMKAINLSKAVLVGHSMGGAISLSMALESPQRVLGLGLVGAGGHYPVNAEFLENTAHEATYQSAVEFLASWAFNLGADSELVKTVQRQMLETRPSVLHGDFMACEAFDVREHLVTIKHPTQVICGSVDKLMPVKHSQYLANQIPSAELTLIPNTGHMVMVEDPQAFTAALEKFLGELHDKKRIP